MVELANSIHAVTDPGQSDTWRTWLEDAHEDVAHPHAGSSRADVMRAYRGVGAIHYYEFPRHIQTTRSNPALGWHSVARRRRITESAESLRHRLDNANRHFRRKAAAVLGDEDAVRLLAELYQSFNLDIEEFDTCQWGITLAKLTAANFCEIGAKVIYITEAGQSFIEALHRE